jgi:peroxin-5
MVSVLMDKSSSAQRFTNHALGRHRPENQFLQHPNQNAPPTQQEFQRFLEESSSKTFEMAPLKQQLHSIEHRGSDWAQEFEQHHPLPPHPAEFEAIYAKVSNETWSNEFQRFQHQQTNLHQQFQGIDWNTEFEKYKGKEPMQEQWQEEFTSKQNELEADQIDTHAGDTVDWQQQFQEIWSKMEESKRAGEGDWASEFKDIFPADMEPESLEVDPVFATCEPYIFEKTNEFLSHPDPYQAGLDLLRDQGSLSLAALAFEAAVQRDEHNSDAWMRLGKIQAENEKEIPAIAALQRAVQENPRNVEALINLAVSYTNEGQTNEAFATMERWFKTKHPEIPIPPLSQGQDMHDRLSNAFLQAVMKDAQHVDSNLQIALGLLYYNQMDYEKTIDCFTAALSTRLDDYLLWNRLGATLSNYGKSILN